MKYDHDLKYDQYLTMITFQFLKNFNGLFESRGKAFTV